MAKECDHDGGSGPKKPRKKRFRNTADRLRQGKETHLGHRASLDWRLDRDLVCEAGGGESFAPLPIAELKRTLSSCRSGKALLAGAGGRKLDIRYDAQIPASQYYPRGEKPVITLNPCRPRGDLISLLTRELRRAWQHRHGALVNPMDFDPDEAILVNRAQAADALMMAIKVSWELKLSGDCEAWNFLAGSPAADMGRTFEIKARSDFRTLNSGAASRAAYDKFFEDIHTKACDKRIIHQMLLDDQGYMRPPAGTPRVTAELFSRMGALPDGRNYLSSQCGTRAPTDMCYAAVEDRSNANFLWFIKFERSFQEKELQMLQESVQLSAEIVDFAKWSVQRLRKDEGEGHAK